MSREYLWKVLKQYGFEKDFTNIIKLLNAKSTVQINVNGILTDKFEIHRGVKQSCLFSNALYVLAINPLVKTIKKDKGLNGTRIRNVGKNHVIGLRRQCHYKNKMNWITELNF